MTMVLECIMYPFSSNTIRRLSHCPLYGVAVDIPFEYGPGFLSLTLLTFATIWSGVTKQVLVH